MRFELGRAPEPKVVVRHLSMTKILRGTSGARMPQPCNAWYHALHAEGLGVAFASYA